MNRRTVATWIRSLSPYDGRIAVGLRLYWREPLDEPPHGCHMDSLTGTPEQCGNAVPPGTASATHRRRRAHDLAGRRHVHAGTVRKRGAAGHRQRHPPPTTRSRSCRAAACALLRRILNHARNRRAVILPASRPTCLHPTADAAASSANIEPRQEPSGGNPARESADLLAPDCRCGGEEERRL